MMIDIDDLVGVTDPATRYRLLVEGCEDALSVATENIPNDHGLIDALEASLKEAQRLERSALQEAS